MSEPAATPTANPAADPVAPLWRDLIGPTLALACAAALWNSLAAVTGL